jgi:uncharacterized protein (TIGR03437 family)
MGILISFVLVGYAFAQNNATVLSTGYQLPSLQLAPGQITTLFVAGLKPSLFGFAPTTAKTIPLPTTLGGISVQLHQMPDDTITPVPLLSVWQFDGCTHGSGTIPQCITTAITVQVPYALYPGVHSDPPRNDFYSELQIIENGTASQSFRIRNSPDQIHLLRSCDINGSAFGTGVCDNLVTHADGVRVEGPMFGPGFILYDSRAHPGETLTMYAYGLGAVIPAVKEGEASPSSPPALVRYPPRISGEYRGTLDYQLLPQAVGPNATPLDVRFVGLAPGWPGLYQINFVVPQPPPGAQACPGPQKENGDLTSEVLANFTVYLQGSFGNDSLSICIDTNSPQLPK